MMNDFLCGPWAPAYAGATEPFVGEGGNLDRFANFFTSSCAETTRLIMAKENQPRDSFTSPFRECRRSNLFLRIPRHGTGIHPAVEIIA